MIFFRNRVLFRYKSTRSFKTIVYMVKNITISEKNKTKCWVSDKQSVFRNKWQS